MSEKKDQGKEESGIVGGGMGRATGAGVPLVVGDKTYIMDPMGVKDLGVAENHLRMMQKNPMDAAMPSIIGFRKKAMVLREEAQKIKKEDAKAAEDKLEEAAIYDQEAENLRADAFKDLRKERDLARIDMPVVLAWLQTYEGIVFATWWGLHKNHPEVDLAKAKEIVDTLGEMDSGKAVKIASGLDDEGNSTGPTEKQAPPAETVGQDQPPNQANAA